MKVEYLGGLFNPKDKPPESGLPEVAVMGRSNVGKSSLINLLLNQRQAARVSKTPGRTQALHFFTVADELCLVDLPGYGYAAAPAEVKKQWPALVYGYLENRPGLKLGLLLVAIRREIRDEERALAERFRMRNIPLWLVVTKADKEAKTRRAAAGQRLADQLGISPKDMLLTSSLSREGKDPLWDKLMRALKERKA